MGNKLTYFQKLLSVERPMPRHLHLQLDNTCGQNKNQIVFSFLAYLVEAKIFDTVSEILHEASRKSPPATFLRRSRPGFGAEPQLPAYVHDSIKPAGLVRVASPNDPRVSAAKPRTAAQRAELDSDKFGDEAARRNRWLD